ncbi:MAG: hypothetical protein JW739_06735 [Opitutales bacterium]|nr:hypothetical protein [Opitutales bacterium]
MKSNPQNSLKLSDLQENELSDPGDLAKKAAESATVMADAIYRLGMPGEDNSRLSSVIMEQTIAQIERIQQLHGFAPNLPFQSKDYHTPPLEDAPFSDEPSLKADAAVQTTAAQAAHALTKDALKEEQGFLAIPLIGLSASAIFKGVTQYCLTRRNAAQAASDAESGYEKAKSEFSEERDS